MGMSHTVTPAELFETARPYGDTPFLLYVGSSGNARVNHVVAHLSDGSDRVVVTGFGRGVPNMLSVDTTLSLLWPPHSVGGLSLIADGTGVMEQADDGDEETEHLVLTITGAVLHRPAPVDGSSTC